MGIPMKIIGRGLTATALRPYQADFDDTVIFASGVSDSRTTDPAQFDREYRLLYEALQTCLKHSRRIVYFSSGGAIYGPVETPRSEATPLFPGSLYGRHKLLCEALIRESTVSYMIVRLPNLVGGRQNKQQLIASLVHQALQGKATLFAQATRDLLDVDDFARLLMQLLQTLNTSETVVMASGQSIPVTDIFDAIQAALHTQADVTLVTKGDTQAFDIQKLRRLLGHDLGFSAGYAQRVVQKYAPLIAQSLP